MTAKTNKTFTAEEMNFLRESNAIEGVYDEDSLKQAKLAWKYLMSQDILTPGVILKTHKILMLHQTHLRPDQRGYFRTVDVWVGDRKGVELYLVPILIQQQFCFETMRKYPDPNWRELHITYEKIHPFVDGNGRTGRMFMNWTRVKRCNLPILVIKESEKQKYYNWFK
jgi:Fic family protein